MLLDKIDPRQRAWVEVSPQAIKANTQAIKGLLHEKCMLMAVVKADGYGHGSQTVAQAALAGGATSLGVATLQEGIDLRKAGIQSPILILGNLINPEDLDSCLCWDLMVTLSASKQAVLCQQLAEAQSKEFAVHIKVDTGMTRLGCDLEKASGLADLVHNLRNVCLKGIYSHLALADQPADQMSTIVGLTAIQRNKFDDILTQISARRNTICCHLANSAGMMRGGTLHYDMVRVGLALYGYSPLSDLNPDLSLEPALTVKARITFIREVPKGTGVGYGHTFTTTRKSRLAVVAIGYADGVSRSLSGKISAVIDGVLVPQVGSIAMDQLVLDITDHPSIKVGSVATILGKDGNVYISPKKWTQLSDLILWEVLCGFKHRLPRLVT